jgi:hypothetical protein
MYPCCQALKTHLAAQNLTPADLARKVSERFNRKRANGVAFDGYYIQGLITGQQYAPDTLRDQIAATLNASVKAAFPEYLIECRKLQQIRLDQGQTQAQLAETASDRAFKMIRSFDISAYECGHRYCHPDTREAIARSLGFTADEVFPEYVGFNAQI